MAKQTQRHFGGNKKAAPLGKGSAAVPTGGGVKKTAAAIPSGRSAVKRGGGKVPAKAKAATRNVA